MYPKEIKDIEKMYFIKEISKSDLPKKVLSHPKILRKNAKKNKELIDKSRQYFLNIEDQEKTINLLQNEKRKQLDTHSEVQLRGKHSYKNDLNAVNFEAINYEGEDIKNSIEKSKPVRGEHSYYQTLNIVENPMEHKAKITKTGASKSSNGSHPFRGILIRQP